MAKLQLWVQYKNQAAESPQNRGDWHLAKEIDTGVITLHGTTAMDALLELAALKAEHDKNKDKTKLTQSVQIRPEVEEE